MAQAGPSWQELIRQGNRAGFVGRDAERAAFLANFDLPAGDARHRFRFHVHGTAGVGKTFLVQELRQLARERGALTAYIDERAGSVPEAMAEVCVQFADQGRRLKDLERRLAVYRDRRHEAEAAALAALAPEQGQQGQPRSASAGSRTAVGLGLAAVEAAVPGAGLFTGALPADLLAQGADRLRTGLSARFRNPDDIELVMSPEKVITPVLLRELRAAASATPWIVLFFDTYERTGPFLDPWLYDLVTRQEADSRLPATVLVVTAGQRPLDTARWSGTGSVADVSLAPFTESESRGLLAGKGVVAEPVVKEVLRLTGGLPVLVSTLAETRPGDPDDVGDPSAGAVKRFLQWEPDDTRRQVARVCALPRQLDADVFRALIGHPDDGLDVPDDPDALYDWLTGLPFVGERGARVRYHDVVRAPMLRLERRRSRREWAGRHRRLAETFARWRTEAEAGRETGTEDLWADEEWRELRLEETYHLLCARPPAALGAALRALVEACREDAVLGRGWARMLEEAGRDTDHTDLAEWGVRLGEALDDDTAGIAGAMALLLARPGPDPAGRALAHTLRGRELRYGGRHREALEEYGRALELDPRLAWAHYGRGYTHQLLDDFPAALAALDRADELAPGTEWIISARAETYRLAGRFEEAVADFDRAVALAPADADPLTGRAVCRTALGRYDEALADFDRALGIEPDNAWALVRRARLRRTRGEPDEAFADFDRAVRVAPDAAWVASERGDAYRLADRSEEAVAELTRALTLKPDYPSALASRGAALSDLGRHEEGLADLARAVELRPDYAWALVTTARVQDELGDRAAMFTYLERAVETAPDSDWISDELGAEYCEEGRYEEAVAVFRRVLDRSPDDEAARTGLIGVHLLTKDHGQALWHLDRALTSTPDDGWLYATRARVCLATGRTDQALADLDRCATLEPASRAAWARRTAIELLTQCDRWEEAAARLSAAEGADDLDDLRCDVHRHAGQWPQALRTAERLRATAPIPGTFQLAMTASQSQGLPAAEPLWRELAALVASDAALPAPESTLGDLERTQARCFLACALADWLAAQEALTDLLSGPPDWDDLATLTLILRDLHTSPQADALRMAPLLTAATRAAEDISSHQAP
ncbi:tetratricopeptide repeat protein [Streptomyces sp. NPDC047070]|uniref:tetratricopeptide repeat protein n=1 Tax=Streptomyces sp. NPDC047070 TaxID=3154923 RepID=UPI00345509F3